MAGKVLGDDCEYTMQISPKAFPPIDGWYVQMLLGGELSAGFPLIAPDSARVGERAGNPFILTL